MLELKLPAGARGARHGSRAQQGRSSKNGRSLHMTDRRTSTLRVGEPAYTAYRERVAAQQTEADEARHTPAAFTPSSASARLVRGRYPASVEPQPSPRYNGDPELAPRPSATPSPRLLPAPSFSDRLVQSEARLVTAAVACTAFFCVLLVIYLGAYARVTSLGIQQSQYTKALRMARQQNELLRAHLAAARSPQHIVAAANAQGMEQAAGRACYISLPAQGGLTHRAAGYQVASDGTDSKQYSANIGH